MIKIKYVPRDFAIFIFTLLSLWLMTGVTVLNDPTRPVDYRVSSLTNETGNHLELTGIFTYPHLRVAIISGKPVTKGDHINEFIVTSIGPDTVELTGPKSNTETLQLITPFKKEYSN